jgi:branched-chain amino acid transport system ATP-binding protein
MLTLSSVQTHIGAYHILHGVDLHVAPGKITVLLGRNGVGKSTTLRTIMGLWQASAGTVHFNGEQIGGPGCQLKTPQIARLGLAYVPENMGIFADLTVKENLVLAAVKQSPVRSDTSRLDFRPFPRS